MAELLDCANEANQVFVKTYFYSLEIFDMYYDLKIKHKYIRHSLQMYKRSSHSVLFSSSQQKMKMMVEKSLEGSF